MILVGIRGLYTGIAAQVVRDIPFYASFFGSYDVFCKMLKRTTDWNDTSIYFVSGGCVTVFYIICVVIVIYCLCDATLCYVILCHVVLYSVILRYFA